MGEKKEMNKEGKWGNGGVVKCGYNIKLPEHQPRAFNFQQGLLS